MSSIEHDDRDDLESIHSQVINMKLSSRFDDIYQDIEKYFAVGYKIFFKYCELNILCFVYNIELLFFITFIKMFRQLLFI